MAIWYTTIWWYDISYIYLKLLLIVLTRESLEINVRGAKRIIDYTTTSKTKKNSNLLDIIRKEMAVLKSTGKRPDLLSKFQ